MTVGDLLKILNDNLSSGTLHQCDDLVIIDIYNKDIDIISAECDTQSSDFNIIVKVR